MPAKATALQELSDVLGRLLPCCELSVDKHQLRVIAGNLVLSVMTDSDSFVKDRFVLVRVKPNGDFLCGNLRPVELIRKVAAAVAAGR